MPESSAVGSRFDLLLPGTSPWQNPSAACRTPWIITAASRPPSMTPSRLQKVVMSLPIGYLSDYRSEEHLPRERPNRAAVRIDFNLRLHRLCRSAFV
jgi:hypothetical protein